MKVKQKEIDFRYSKPILYYTLFFGGILVCVLLFILLFRLFLNSIGLNADGVGINPYWEKQGGDMGLAIIVSGAFIGLLFSFLFPLKIALKVTDKKGRAVFNEREVCFTMEKKNINIPYEKVQRIIFTVVKSGKTGGPPLYRLKIETNRKYHIQCAFKEAWECRKKKSCPTIWYLSKEFSSRTGIAVESVINTWG